MLIIFNYYKNSLYSTDFLFYDIFKAEIQGSI